MQENPQKPTVEKRNPSLENGTRSSVTTSLDTIPANSSNSDALKLEGAPLIIISQILE